MKGRIKMSGYEWLKLLAVSGAVIASIIVFTYGCNLAIASCLGVR